MKTKNQTENWEKWISFLSWVNKLSPWNLWYPQKWQEEKELNPKVEEALKELLKSEEKKVKNQLLEEVIQMKIPERFPDRKTEGYNLALAELEEKLKEEIKKGIK